MIPITYYAPGETTSPRFAQSFARGARGQTRSVVSGRLAGHGFAGFVSPALYPLLTQTIAAGEPWYYGDHAFYYRYAYYRVTANARQFVPTVQDLADARPDRLNACHVTYEADWRWSNAGSSIIVCPNSTTYMAQFGLDVDTWIHDVSAIIRRYTDRPIIVRHKAQAKTRPIGVDLHDAWAVVVYNSAAALDAIRVGVPVYVLCPWSTFAPMGCADLTQIENPMFPDDRERFLWSLAEHQWTFDELDAGQAWEELCRR